MTPLQCTFLISIAALCVMLNQQSHSIGGPTTGDISLAGNDLSDLTNIPTGPLFDVDLITGHTGAPPPKRRLRALSTRPRVSYVDPDRDIRPVHLADMIGQSQLKKTLRVFLDAALRRGEPLDHVFLSGPPGLGKTTIANVIGTELDARVTYLTGGSVTTAELRGFISECILDCDISDADYKHRILFIDEIHAMDKQAQTMFLPLIEDFRYLDARLAPFTCIGATTDPARVTKPLRERFGIEFALDYYDDADIALIIRRTLGVLCGLDDVYMDLHLALGSPAESALNALSTRARGVPRVANKLLRRTLDFIPAGTADGDDSEPDDDSELGELGETKLAGFNSEIISIAMKAIGISSDGLTDLDRKVLRAMLMRFHGKPVGMSALSSALGESPATIEFSVEPPLVRMGYIDRTPTGRVLTERGSVAAAHVQRGTVSY